MNRRELIAAVAAHTGQDPKVIDRTLRGLVDVVSATVKRGDPVVVSGFTKWTMVKRAARTARNPRTGEPVKVKASHRVRITPLKALKDVATGAAPAPKLNKAGPTERTGSGRSRAEAAQAAAVPQAAAVGRKAATTKKATAKATGTKKATAKKATATTGTARGTTAKKASATKATEKKAGTKKAGVTKATAKKATATNATAKKATAKKATAKKATAKKATAKKATARGR